MLKHWYSMKRINWKVVAGVSEIAPNSQKDDCMHFTIERMDMLWCDMAKDNFLQWKILLNVS